MANNKDLNADLGDQTITDTEPPIVFEATVVSDDEPIIISAPPPVEPTAPDLDAQLDALLSDIPKDEPVSEPQPDLDAQLDALLFDIPHSGEPTVTAEPEASEPIILTPPAGEPVAEQSDLDAKLDALLAEDAVITPPPQEPDLDAQLDALLSDIPPTVEPTVTAEPAAAEPDLDAQLDAMLNDMPVTEPATEPAPQQSQQPRSETQSQQQAPSADNTEMMAQMMNMMEQLRKAQNEQQSGASKQEQEKSSETQAALLMMEQARQMMAQAQAAQLQAQAARTAQQQPTQQPQSGSSDEVTRLKSELEGMRDLVNKLTLSLTQQPQQQQAVPLGVQQTVPPVIQQPYFMPVGDQYHKLESELDRMRRDILEKDLREKEKELERKQKEAENNVKDIRPEMIQMSDSRDLAPAAPPIGGGGIGGEYIPLANGVYYSTKDRQIYVMTPASNAAAAKPTLEKSARPAAPKRAARPAAKRHSARRPMRPGMRPRHRPGMGRPRPKR